MRRKEVNFLLKIFKVDIYPGHGNETNETVLKDRVNC